MKRNVLFFCGILSSLLYVVTDILAGMLWEGYSFIDHAVSELSAIGAPTRPLVVSLLLAHDALVIAFGLGVWRYGRKRPQRFVGGLLVGYAVVGLVGLPFPIHQRGAEATFTDTMHSALTGVTVLLIHALSSHGRDRALNSAGHGIRSDRTRKAVPPLLDRHTPDDPRAWRWVGLRGRCPDCRTGDHCASAVVRAH